MRIQAAVALALALGGCEPSLSHLVKTHSYPDAMCLAELQQLGAADRRQLLHAMAVESGQSIQVDVINPEALRQRFGALGAEVLRRRVILRLAYALPRFSRAGERGRNTADWEGRGTDYSAVRVVKSEVGLELRAGGKPLQGEPMDRPHLLALTQERPPEPQLSRGTSGSSGGKPGLLRMLVGAIVMPFELVGVIAGKVTATALNVGTLGNFRSPVPNYKPMQVTEGLLRDTPPTPAEPPALIPLSEEDYRRATPVAEALYETTRVCLDTSFVAGPPVWHGCSLLLLERPADEATVSLEVRLRWVYGLGETQPTCKLSDEVVIPLPPGPTLEARLLAALGGGPRPLAPLLAAP